MLELADFSYPLPQALIAQKPSAERDHCRLLVYHRDTQKIYHHIFSDLPEILSQKSGQLVFVRNNSRVIPARLFGHKTSGGLVEIFLTRQLQSTAKQQIWECLTKPGLKPGQIVEFTNSDITLTCRESAPGYTRQLVFQATPNAFRQLIDTQGKTPIPPYIQSLLNEKQLRTAYQTIYARQPGSVAAPTAGLHFTPALIQKLEDAGFPFIDVTLHVGLGTFLAVKENDVRRHQMHREYYSIDQKNLQKLRQAHQSGKKILAIGTTSARVLETIANKLDDTATTLSGETDIFLYPPAKFHLVDHLLTNFHLPRSTLLMLVAAFTSQPNCDSEFHSWRTSPLGKAYEIAIAERYRFFSFGDAMLIL